MCNALEAFATARLKLTSAGDSPGLSSSAAWPVDDVWNYSYSRKVGFSETARERSGGERRSDDLAAATQLACLTDTRSSAKAVPSPAQSINNFSSVRVLTFSSVLEDPGGPPPQPDLRALNSSGLSLKPRHSKRWQRLVPRSRYRREST